MIDLARALLGRRWCPWCRSIKISLFERLFVETGIWHRVVPRRYDAWVGITGHRIHRRHLNG